MSRKGWIDRQRATTYTLMHVPGKGTMLHAPNMPIEPNDEYEEELAPPRGYNYEQHLRTTGARGAVFVLRSGAVVAAEEAPELEETDYGTMYADESALLEEEYGERLERGDPDVDAALANYDEGEFEPLDDAFLAELNAPTTDFDVELPPWEGEETATDLWDVDEDAHSEDRGDQEPRGKRALDEHFEAELARFDREFGGDSDSDYDGFDGYEGFSEDEAPALTAAESSAYGTLLERTDMTGPHVRHAYEPEKLPVRMHDEDSESRSEEEVIVEHHLEKWDVESIISTYSTTDNHPGRIAPDVEGVRRKRRPRRDEEQEQQEESGSDEDEAAQRAPAVTTRERGETAEARKARKRAVREEKAARRATKKETKLSFKREEVRQQRVRAQAGGSAHKTVVTW